ncbi:MAG: PAS domain S-box protein [Melioribacteraceae bacterium]|nr:PAS domain S-box protein [Melioribacteraceae bacterium]
MLRLLIYILIVCSSIIYSQDLSYKYYSNEDGLPERQVYDVVQDTTGLMWFATEAGIMTYDGTEWKLLKDEYPELDYRMIKIKLDSEGNVYFLPYSSIHDIIRVKNDKIDKIPLRYKNNLPFRITDFEVMNGENELKIAVSSGIDSLYLYKNDSTYIVNLKEKPFDYINDISQFNGEFYLATTDGIQVLGFNNNIYIDKFEEDRQAENVLALEILDDGTNIFSAYGLTEKAIFEYRDRERIEITNKVNLPEYFTSRAGYSIKKIKNKEIFYYGEMGMFNKYDKFFNTRLYFPLEDNIRSHGVTSLFEDKENNLWTTSLRGINKIKQNLFVNYTSINGLFKNEVSAVEQFDDGRIVLGHNGGISVLDDKKIHKIPIQNDRTMYDRVLDIDKDKDGNIWFAIERRTLGFLDKSLNLKTIELGDYSIQSLLWDHENTIWISNQYKEIVRLNYKFEKLNTYKYEILNYTRRMYEFSDHNIYICSSLGFHMIDKKDLNSSDIKPIKKGLSCYCAFEDSEATIFVGTKNGLLQQRGIEFEKVNFNNFNLDFPIYSVSKENDSTYWFGTEKGIIRWDKKENNVEQFTMSDGLAGNETNRAANFIDKDGILWIGTDKGLSSFNLKNKRNIIPKPVGELLSVENIEGEKFKLNEELEFPYNQNNLFFKYRGYSYLDETKNIFRIELTDDDNEIIFFNETRETKYLINNIDPGKYYFRFQFKNAKGIWSEPITSALIKINSPFYKEPWAITGVFIFFGVFFFYIYDYISSKKYSKDLEKKVEERTLLLSVSEKRHKKLLETSPVAIVITDSFNSIIFCNEQTYSQFNFVQGDQIEGRDFSTFINKKSVIDFNEILFGTIKYESVREREIVFNKKNGESFPGMINTSVIFDEVVNRISIIYTVKDISIHKQAELNLQNLNKELEIRVNQKTSEIKGLLTQSPFAIAIFRADGSIEEVNNIFHELFKDNNILEILKNYNVFKDNTLLNSEYFEIVKKIFTEGGSFTSPIIPFMLQENNKADKWIRARLYSIHREGSVVNKVVGMIEDVTERIKMEEISNKLIEQKKYASAVIGAVEKERARISRDLHDGIGQILTGIKIKLDGFEFEHNIEDENLEDVGNLITLAGGEIRNIIYDLHPIVIENYGLLHALKNLCNRIKKDSSFKIVLNELNYSNKLEKQNELPVFRIVQEAFNNIVKHANCKTATLTIREYLDENLLALTVEDDGVGFDINKVSDKCFGLNNLKQRTEFLGGEIEINSEINAGTKIFIKIPFA